MLVLSRKVGERIVLRIAGLEETMEIEVVDIRGQRTRLGFEASNKITIIRKEIEEKCPNIQAH